MNGERKPTNEELEAMTVNERLWACELYERYVECARKRDREGMISILAQVALTRSQAAEVADKVLADPARFGF